jgi:hypothetical protein
MEAAMSRTPGPHTEEGLVELVKMLVNGIEVGTVGEGPDHYAYLRKERAKAILEVLGVDGSQVDGWPGVGEKS